MGQGDGQCFILSRNSVMSTDSIISPVFDYHRYKAR
jgi:hypothetical protein